MARPWQRAAVLAALGLPAAAAPPPAKHPQAVIGNTGTMYDGNNVAVMKRQAAAILQPAAPPTLSSPQGNIHKPSGNGVIGTGLGGMSQGGVPGGGEH